MSLIVGLRVKALFDDTIHWYPAVIVQVNLDGTFGLRYDDGDSRDDVRAQDIIPDDQPVQSNDPTTIIKNDEIEKLKEDITNLQNVLKGKEHKIDELEEKLKSAHQTCSVTENRLSESVDAGLIALKRAETAEAKLQQIEMSVKHQEVPSPFDPSLYTEACDIGSLIHEIASFQKNAQVEPTDLKVASRAVEVAGEAWNFLRRRCEALLNCAVNKEPLPVEFGFTPQRSKANTIAVCNVNNNTNIAQNIKSKREISSISGLNNTWQKPDTPAHTSEPSKLGLRPRRTVEPKQSNGYASDDTPKSDSSPLTINDSPMTSPIPSIDTNVSPTTEYTFHSPSTNRPPSKLWGISSVLGSSDNSGNKQASLDHRPKPDITKQETRRAPSPVAERVRQWKATSNTPTDEAEPRDSSKGRSQRRIASPFIARKLASWKTSDNKAEGDSPISGGDPEQPASTKANSWLKNQNTAESRPRNSPSPARRYSSPVSERVKQWRAAANRNQNSAASSNATVSSNNTPTASLLDVSSAPEVEPTQKRPELEIDLKEKEEVSPEPAMSSSSSISVASDPSPSDGKPLKDNENKGEQKPSSNRKVSEFKNKPDQGPKEEISQNKLDPPAEAKTEVTVRAISPKELTLGLGGGPTGNGLEAGLQFMVPDSLAVGSTVNALFDDHTHFYSAVVNAVEPNGQVHLRFDDGDEREHVPLSEIRVKDEKTAKMHIGVDSEEEPNSIDKLQAMLVTMVPPKESKKEEPASQAPTVVQKKATAEIPVPLSPKGPRLNRFSANRGSNTPPRRASPLRGILEKDSSKAAGQAKKQLSQLEQMREEVARIRLMNERDMPAIADEDEPPSPVTSPTQPSSNSPLQLSETILEEADEGDKPKVPESPVVSQRLRAWQSRHGNEPAAPRPGSLSGPTPRSSSTGNSTTGSARTLFVGGGDRGSNSTGRVLGGDSSIRTIPRSSIQSSNVAPRVTAVTPPPRSNSRGPTEASSQEDTGKAKLRNMSPLIAQRMAAFHKSR